MYPSRFISIDQKLPYRLVFPLFLAWNCLQSSETNSRAGNQKRGRNVLCPTPEWHVGIISKWAVGHLQPDFPNWLVTPTPMGPSQTESHVGKNRWKLPNFGYILAYLSVITSEWQWLSDPFSFLLPRKLVLKRIASSKILRRLHFENR